MHPKLNKTIAIIIALFAILAVFVGCGNQETTGGKDPIATATPTAAPTATPTPAPTLGQLLPNEILIELNIDSFSIAPQVYYLGGNSILITWKEDSQDSIDSYAQQETHTATYNLATGEYTLGPTFAYEFMIVDTNPTTGQILASNYSGKEFYFLGSDLSVTKTLAVDNYGAIFNADFTKYYLAFEGYLYECDVATGAKRYIETPYGMRVSYVDAFDSKNNHLYISVNTSMYKYGTASMVLDVVSGQPLSLNTEQMSRVFVDGAAYAVNFADGGFRLNKEMDGSRYSIAPSTVEDDWTYGYRLIIGSPYFVKNYTYVEGELSGKLINKLYRIDGEKLFWCDFTDKFEGNISYLDYIESDNMLLSMVKDGDKWKLVLLRTDLLTFTEVANTEKSNSFNVDKTIVDNFIADSTIEEVAEHLAALRQRADDLEKRFGFKIFLSNQCAKPLQNSSYVSAYTNSLPSEYERNCIAFSLNELEQVAARYPDNFFEQFKDAQGNGGIYIYLIGSITSTNNTIAYFNKGTYTYNVALDVTYQYGQQGNFAHELWHAIEAKASSMDPDWDDGWDELNPDGFAYYDTYDYYDNDSVHWTYYDWRKDGVYFVDAYAKTYAKEDRSRIMEKVMGDPSLADDLMKNDTMKAKLNFMCDVVRKTFDTTGWGELYWERY